VENRASKDEHVISKQRVSEYGEVFTPSFLVNDMLDLVKQETERIDSRFLEPACGNGNFLVEILKRKLTIVEKRYSKNQIEYERYSIIALSSIYGVEILEDNVQTCRDRLFGIFSDFYTKNYKSVLKSEFFDSAKFILKRNILWGDALDLKTPDEKAEPIIFSEWSAVNGSMIKRRDFKMVSLLGVKQLDEMNLFSDLGDNAFIPTPVKDYPLTHFLNLCKEDAAEL